MIATASEGMLGVYRVLDLTDEKGLFCGKILGDLGADVLKLERPGGDPARNLGPFYHDEPDPEKSLNWFAYNTNKKGITLNIEAADGQKIFKRLTEDADFVIESFLPGYMDKLGLGYTTLKKINPRIIMVSISSFGQTGPYRDYIAPDIVAWAMGGQMYPIGYPDKPPLRISHYSHAYLQASMEAAAGALTALYYRGLKGQGQHVDVSIHESIARMSQYVVSLWDMEKFTRPHGTGIPRPSGSIMPWMWPCKDGHVMWIWWFGQAATRRNKPLIDWMEKEGVDTKFLKELDWEGIDLKATVINDLISKIGESTFKFFSVRTKNELLDEGIRHHAMIYPVSTVEDIMTNAHSLHLAARGYWATLEHPELGDKIIYPGVFANASEAPLRMRYRAPLIGEHNREVYEGELGFSRQQLIMLKQTKVI